MSTSSVKFEQLCDEALRQAGDLSAAARDRVVEDLRLRFEFPGEYVAYLDKYGTVNRLRHLQRQLIAHSAAIADVQEAIQRYPDTECARIAIEFADPLGDDFRVAHDLPFR